MEKRIHNKTSFQSDLSTDKNYDGILNDVEFVALWRFLIRIMQANNEASKNSFRRYQTSEHNKRCQF